MADLTSIRSTNESDETRSIEDRAYWWLKNGEVGASSQRIWKHMMGEVIPLVHVMTWSVKYSRCIWTKTVGSYPNDADDFNRCALLLKLIPEWKPRMIEMAGYGGVWKSLAEHWDEITNLFFDETKSDLNKFKAAPKTDALIKKLCDEARDMEIETK